MDLVLRFGNQKFHSGRAIVPARMIVYWGVHTGIAKEFIQGVDGGGRCQFAGVFEKYAPARGNVWASAGKVVVVVDAKAFEKSRAYVRLDKRDLHALSHRV